MNYHIIITLMNLLKKKKNLAGNMKHLPLCSKTMKNTLKSHTVIMSMAFVVFFLIRLRTIKTVCFCDHV